MKTDKTDANATSPKNSREVSLAQACLALANVEKTLADLLDASGSGSRTDVALARLDHQEQEDVVLICDIKLVSKAGTIASVRSENTLPGALEPHMLSASHGNFCNMLDAVITNPLVSSFQAFLTKRARASKSDKDLQDALEDPQTFQGLLDDD